jgi:hypothetical protein
VDKCFDLFLLCCIFSRKNKDMKTSLFFTLFCVFFLTAGAQAPQAFKYQAVARNSSGELLVNKAVTFRISILQGSASGSMVYSELHSKTTNSFGLVELEIGNGTSPSGTFSGINWGASTYFVKVEMDPAGGIAFQTMGTSQLLSVPYALYAKDVQNKDDADASITNEIQTLSIVGNQLTLSKSGGTVTVPGSDNWGSQTVVTDATLAGTGLTSNPLKIPDNVITSAKITDGAVTTADILDGTIANADLSTGSVTGTKIADATITSTDLADDAVTVTKISSSGAAANQVLYFSGSDVVWGYGPGAEIKITSLNSGSYSVSTFTSSTYSKIGDLGSFTKTDASSRVEITFHGRIFASTMSGTGAHFELRVDNVATTNGRARAILRASEAGVGSLASITGVFTGLSVGTHTISMWVLGAGNGGTVAMTDPGNFADDHIIVREIK